MKKLLCALLVAVCGSSMLLPTGDEPVTPKSTLFTAWQTTKQIAGATVYGTQQFIAGICIPVSLGVGLGALKTYIDYNLAFTTFDKSLYRSVLSVFSDKHLLYQFADSPYFQEVVNNNFHIGGIITGLSLLLYGMVKLSEDDGTTKTKTFAKRLARAGLVGGIILGLPGLSQRIALIS